MEARQDEVPASVGERLYRWLDARFGVAKLVDFARHKEVPVGGHSMVWYYLGGTTLFFFAVQLVSGVLLLMYYQPGEATSYESIGHQAGVVLPLGLPALRPATAAMATMRRCPPR